MSHCTNFKFQYVDKSLIIKTFECLNLACSEDYVYSFSSGFEKFLGINGKDKTAALVASQDGFHYFMCDRGNFYELIMEKHNMTADDAALARIMANEFQNLYVKNAVQAVMKKFENQGISCCMEESQSGFEIKFGNLYEKSLFIKLQNGRVVENVKGVKGQSCQSITEVLENMLSSEDVELNTEWTEEYYEDPDDGLTIYNLEKF